MYATIFCIIFNYSKLINCNTVASLKFYDSKRWSIQYSAVYYIKCNTLLMCDTLFCSMNSSELLNCSKSYSMLEYLLQQGTETLSFTIVNQKISNILESILSCGYAVISSVVLPQTSIHFIFFSFFFCICGLLSITTGAFSEQKNSNHVFSPRQQLCSQTLCADSVKNRVPYCDVINSCKVKTFTQALSVVIAGMTRTVKKRHSDENPLEMFLMTPRLHI